MLFFRLLTAALLAALLTGCAGVATLFEDDGACDVARDAVIDYIDGDVSKRIATDTVRACLHELRGTLLDLAREKLVAVLTEELGSLFSVFSGESTAAREARAAEILAVIRE